MIKKWEDRRDIHDYHAGPIRNTVIHELMQAEIDELRVALEFETACYKTADRIAKKALAELAALKGQEPVGEVIATGVIRWTKNYPVVGSKLYLAAGAQPSETEAKDVCKLCGSDSPFTGSCGGGRNNPKALCYEAAPVQAGAQVNFEEQPDGSVIPVDPSEMQAQECKTLTDEQITEVWRELRARKEDWSDLDFARAIEAYIKEQP